MDVTGASCSLSLSLSFIPFHCIPSNACNADADADAATALIIIIIIIIIFFPLLLSFFSFLSRETVSLSAKLLLFHSLNERLKLSPRLCSLLSCLIHSRCTLLLSFLDSCLPFACDSCFDCHPSLTPTPNPDSAAAACLTWRLITR